MGKNNDFIIIFLLLNDFNNFFLLSRLIILEYFDILLGHIKKIIPRNLQNTHRTSIILRQPFVNTSFAVNVETKGQNRLIIFIIANLANILFFIDKILYNLSHFHSSVFSLDIIFDVFEIVKSFNCSILQSCKQFPSKFPEIEIEFL